MVTPILHDQSSMHAAAYQYWDNLTASWRRWFSLSWVRRMKMWKRHCCISQMRWSSPTWGEGTFNSFFIAGSLEGGSCCSWAHSFCEGDEVSLVLDNSRKVCRRTLQNKCNWQYLQMTSQSLKNLLPEMRLCFFVLVLGEHRFTHIKLNSNFDL